MIRILINYINKIGIYELLDTYTTSYDSFDRKED